MAAVRIGEWRVSSSVGPYSGASVPGLDDAASRPLAVHDGEDRRRKAIKLLPLGTFRSPRRGWPGRGLFGTVQRAPDQSQWSQPTIVTRKSSPVHDAVRLSLQ